MKKSYMLTKMMNVISILDESEAESLEKEILQFLRDKKELKKVDLSSFIKKMIKNKNTKYDITEDNLDSMSEKIADIYIENSKNNALLDKRLGYILYIVSIITMFNDNILNSFKTFSTLGNKTQLNYIFMLLIFILIYFIDEYLTNTIPVFMINIHERLGEISSTLLFSITFCSYLILVFNSTICAKGIIAFFMIFIPLVSTCQNRPNCK